MKKSKKVSNCFVQCFVKKYWGAQQWTNGLTIHWIVINDDSEDGLVIYTAGLIRWPVQTDDDLFQ